MMNGHGKRYSNGEVTILWQPEKCIHSKRCFHGLPAVFDPASRPWIRIEAAASAEIVRQVNDCPSGALSLVDERHSPDAPKPDIPCIELQPEGPLLVHGPVTLRLANGDEQACDGPRTALCRCGASANKPFCDGSHRKVGFKG
ncbi:(4Fe-4S)-binding protein [Jeongeupia naejangsanensis]|uniref:(4Fe-4S)-binding protein n=1 Tax=Jeongeupia naejangsanensis TaxID=613195 RepID=A0ABS2BNF2_9NEIS|nr:(4Fe-4S)-binding protein [Jeongeupia naejangsanensis]MBM3117146.1 (4Fe-4S)-binding protein [Jeongeupia naejangsanensis]